MAEVEALPSTGLPAAGGDGGARACSREAIETDGMKLGVEGAQRERREEPTRGLKMLMEEAQLELREMGF